jgi:hypothetical protein
VVRESAALLPFYARLETLPGVGKILVLFISMEGKPPVDPILVGTLRAARMEP